MAKIDLAAIAAREPKTLLSKMGFADGDLTTPLHDEIMLWLDAGLRSGPLLEIVIGALGATPPWITGWSSIVEEKVEKCLMIRSAEMHQEIAGCEHQIAHHDEMIDNYKRAAATESSNRDSYLGYSDDEQKKRTIVADRLAELTRWRGNEVSWRTERTEALRASAPPYRGPEIDTRWEQPIDNGRFITGYIDLRLSVVFYEPKIGLSKGNESWMIKPWYCKEVCDYDESSIRVGFEVKSKIPSLGELIRQIRTYQARSVTRHWFVVCPDDRFAAPLKAQGIHFLKYENA